MWDIIDPHAKWYVLDGGEKPFIARGNSPEDAVLAAKQETGILMTVRSGPHTSREVHGADGTFCVPSKGAP